MKQIVARFAPRKVFLIIDNAPWHNLKPKGKVWLKENRDLIELFRLPAYSPEFMPVEGIWKKVRKLTTHNRFYATVAQRDAALRKTFSKFQRKPALIAPNVARFR